MNSEVERGPGPELGGKEGWCGGGIEGVSMVAWTLRKCEFRGGPGGSSQEVLRWTVGAVGLGTGTSRRCPG